MIVAWDWNDGTTQGWTGSTTATNADGRLIVTNQGNGSLQIFSPDLSDINLLNLSTLRFDLTINSYSTVASPGDLAQARAILQPLNPAPPLLIHSWDLDLSNLAFGQTRSFNLSIQNGSGSGSLAALGRISFLFSDSSLTENTSSALLDNFVVSSAVPEPSVNCLISVGIAVVHLSRRLKVSGVRRHYV